MKNTFLTGSFLSGYSSVFRYNRPQSQKRSNLTAEILAARFEVRSKRLRNKQARYTLGLQAGLVSAIVVVLFAFQIPINPNENFEVAVEMQELVTLEEIQQTKHEMLPPPPPRPIVPLVVPDDEVLEDEDLDLDVALELDEAIVNLTPPPIEEDEPAEFEVFMVVEEMPKIKGGLASLMQAVDYPVLARKNNIEGNVIVKIVVNEKGIPLEPVIIRSPSPLLEEAALEAVMKQRFEPGRQRGQAVKVEMVIPVKFRLRG